MLDRFGVARALREIASLMEAERANPFKVKAYERGARALEGMAEDLGLLVREERLTSVPGIGKALAATISELFRTGTSPQLDRLRQRLPPGVQELGHLRAQVAVARQAQRGQEPERHRLTVAVGGIAGDGLDGVADGVPEIQRLPGAAVAFVAGHDPQLGVGTRRDDLRRGRIGAAPDQLP